MTENNDMHSEAVEADLSASNTDPSTESQEGAEKVSESNLEAPTAIPDDKHLEKLKNEAAQSRIRAKELEAKLDDAMEKLRALAVEHATKDILPNGAEHLGWSDEWLDDDGYPSGDKIREAAAEYLADHPYLGRVRGEVGAGQHGSGQAAPSLGELLRRASGAA